MLKDRTDEFYDARLIATARLHLGTVVNGQSSEMFFATMCKIIDRKAYLGYKAFNGKDVKLSGVKDFIFNSLYGLGVKKATLSTLLANCMKAATNDKSQAQYSVRVVKWLAAENEAFDFPQEMFEFFRIKASIESPYKKPGKTASKMLKILSRLYHQYPSALQHIGPDRKYKNVFECARDFTIWDRPERLTPITLYKHPRLSQIHDLAENLSERLDMKKRRILIASMIELYKRDKALYEHSPADDV